MAEYPTLLTDIDSTIRTNGTKSITAQEHNTLLKDIVTTVGGDIKIFPQDGLRGFNRLDKDHIGVTNYDATTRTFTIQPDHDYFEFWAGGKYYKKTVAQSIQWLDTSSIYYFLFDTNGILQFIVHSDFTEAIFKESAICGLVYWNATSQNIILEAIDEQHGMVNAGGMDSATHFRLHMVDGAVWLAGGDVTGLVDSSNTYIGINTSLSADEDITIVTPTSTSHKFIWREGADGVWFQSETADNNIGLDNGGNTYYNAWNDTTNEWELVEGGYSTDFVIYYFLWTNDKDYPIKKLVGQQAYSSRSEARDGLDKEVGNIDLEGFPSTEAYIMYAYIVKRDGNLEDDGSGNAYVDMRGKFKFNA